MSRAFVDTNVFVYAVDRAEPRKREIAVATLESEDDIAISTQVLGEFFVVATGRLSPPMSEHAALEAIDRLARLPTVSPDVEMVRKAARVATESRISYWDGLIVAAAAAAGCARLLTEDLNPGQEIEGVLVENPFAPA